MTFPGATDYLAAAARAKAASRSDRRGSTSSSRAHSATPEIELDQCRPKGYDLEFGCFPVTYGGADG